MTEPGVTTHHLIDDAALDALCAKSSSLTSVPTVRLMRLPSTTVGVKLSPMPKFLNWTLVPLSLTVE